MSITLPTGDRNIDSLLVELTTLVSSHGKNSFQVEQFLKSHENDAWTDRFTGVTHYFFEIGEVLAELMGGITNHEEEEEEPDAADWWKQDADNDESWKS